MEALSKELMIYYEIEMPNPDLPHYRLLGNGAQMNCPFKTVTMIPTPSGQFGTIQHSCSTDCPLVELVELENETFKYATHCGCRPVERIVKEKREQIIHRVPTLIKP